MRARIRILTLIGTVAALGVSPAWSQDTGHRPPANPADVRSIDAMISALYDVISGAAGEPRDWDRFRSLFVAEARLIPTGPTPEGGVSHRTASVEGYIGQTDRFFQESGFYEVELSRKTERFGPIAHAFSTYASRRDPHDAEPFMRGINSIQLLYDGSRWWIVSIFFASERGDMPIPTRYLHAR